MYLVYQVEAWIPDRRDWYPVGPVFTALDAAERYMTTIAPKLPLRLVDLPAIDSVLLTEARAVCELPLARLQSARHLAESRRVN